MHRTCLTLMLSLLAWVCCASSVHAQSTAFTYQGLLREAGQPASGLHDFRFRLFGVASGGTQLGTTLCLDNLQVTDGTFTATLDFGNQFITPDPRYLEIEVRRDTGLNCSNLGGFVILSPRQLLAATPMATHAKSAFSLDSANGGIASVVFVANSGKVGIGTTTPTASLEVMAAPVGSPGEGEGIRIRGPLAGSANQAYVTFCNGVGTAIGYVGDGSTGDNNVYVGSYFGDVTLNTSAGRVLNATVGGNVGIGTTVPAAKLDVRGDIRLGTSGELHTVGSGEPLRLIRGSVSPTGTIQHGDGFTVFHDGVGEYTINFNTPFTDIPVLTATPHFLFGGAKNIAMVGTRSLFYVKVHVFVVSGSANDGAFSFTCTGPR